MKSATHISRAFAFVAVIVGVLLLSPQQALADPGSLSGPVTESASNLISGVVIDVINPGTGNVVATDTTDANGDYLIPTLADDAYTLRATPPAGSGFSVATILNVVVSGSTIRDIVLVPESTPNTFSGTLKDSAGNPVPDMVVRLTDQGFILFDSTTGSDGAFSVLAPPSQWNLHLARELSGPAADNAQTTYFVNAGTVDLSTGDVTEELSTGDVTLTVNVVDPDGFAVANSTVFSNNYQTQYTAGGRTYSGTVSLQLVNTGADGSVTYRLPPTRNIFPN